MATKETPKVEVESKQELINGVAQPIRWSIRVGREHGWYGKALYGLTSEEIRLIRDELNKLPN